MSTPPSRKPAATAPARPASPGRPKDLAKGAAILDAAKRMFTEHGFDRTSMDQIASEAGVSKLTVYSHFGDKEALFAAAVKSHCETRLPDALFEPSPDTPLRERLLRSEEHTSELQSLMRTSYAVFCLTKKNIQENTSKT